MFEGSILKAGIPEELAADEMVRKVYLRGKTLNLEKRNLRFNQRHYYIYHTIK